MSISRVGSRFKLFSLIFLLWFASGPPDNSSVATNTQYEDPAPIAPPSKTPSPAQLETADGAGSPIDGKVVAISSPGPNEPIVSLAPASVKLEESDDSVSSGRPFFVSAGATWSYLDDGSDQGTAWTGSSFDDSLWASGPAELGYGDTQDTMVGCGCSTPTCTDSACTPKNITTYFRHDFTVTGAASVYGLKLSVICDDGIVVYLNGLELFRDNMPVGTPTYTTLASSNVGTTGEVTWVVDDTVDKSLLAEGPNVLAVEIHQDSTSSSDISFNLMLEETFPPNETPNEPTSPVPADGATGVDANPQLCVTVTDPEADPMDVTFYGREKTTGSTEDFTIVVLPDTQIYSQTYPAHFTNQTQWVVDNKVARNIVFVAHVGDIVNTASVEAQWINADAALDLLDPPGDPELMPYGLSVGNHDQPTTLYNAYFGLSRFAGRSYYGGNFGSDNDNSYQLFSVSGMDFIAIDLEYDESSNGMDPLSDDGSATWDVLNWADGLLTTYSNRRAIINSHYILTGSASWSNMGTRIYNWFQDNDNVFLTVCGHTGHAARRADPTISGDSEPDGNCDDPGKYCINSVLADYQFLTEGGNGWLRIMTFSPDNDTIHVQAYSPSLDEYMQICDESCVCSEHADNQTGPCGNDFYLAYDMPSGLPFEQIGATQLAVSDGAQACVDWPGGLPGTEYEWYVTVADVQNLTTGPRWTFTSDGTCTANADCVDSLFCNGVESCDTGGTNSCVAGADPCPGQLCDEELNVCVACVENADCNDDDVCTSDVCNAGICQNTNNTAPCNDGDLCTTSDACSGGTCAGTPLDCSDGNGCTDDVCTNGVCSNPYDPIAGCCTDAADCDDFDTCTTDSCDMSNSCVNAFITGCCTNDGHCDDADLCTVDTCDEANLSALSFDGGNDYLDLGDPGGANTCADDPGTPNFLTSFGDSSFTIEGWVYSRDATPGDYTGIFRQGRQVAFPQVAVQMMSSGNIALSVEPCGTGQKDVSAPLPVNEWHHFAMVVDRGTLSSTAGDQWLRLYIDGVEEASTDASVQWAAKKINNAAAESAVLGAARSSAGALIARFDGLIDEVRIWDHVRTPAEILGNYPLQVTSGTGLMHRWAMNESVGLTAADSVGTADGTLSGATWETVNLVDFGAGECVFPPVDCSGLMDECNTAACNPASGACDQTPINDTGSCDDGNSCTAGDTCSGGTCAGTPIAGCCLNNADCDDSDACTVDECVSSTANGVSLELVGTNDYVDVGNDASLLGGTAGISIEAWIYPRPASLGSSNRGTVLEKRTPSEIKGDYGIYLANNHVVWRLYQSTNEGAGSYEGSIAISADSWQHVAVTYDDLTGVRKIYVDGVLDPTADANPRAGITSGSLSVHDLWFGRNDQGDFLYFDGLIDEVRIWDHPLSAADILANMDQPVSSAAGLISRWSFDDNDAATTVYDTAGAPANDGTLTNGAALNTSNVPLLDATNSCSYSTAVCDDGNVCTADSCHAVTGCLYDPAPNETDPCDDGNPCTTTDQCDALGACAGVPDPGAACTDGFTCTENDVCDVAGLCVAGTPNDTLCDDSEPCTVNSCDPLDPGSDPFDGCVATLSTDPCDDNNVCTTNDQCVDPNIRSVVGTDTDPLFPDGPCPAATSLTRLRDPDLPASGFANEMINWLHTYTPFTADVVSATLTIDAGDIDAGQLELRAADGTAIGVITGGDNGGPGPFVCPWEWDAAGADPDGNDIVFAIPSSLYPDLADGSFFVETVQLAGAGSWASNRAVLTIELAQYCSGDLISCDDGDVCNGIEVCDPVLGCQAGPAFDCGDGNDCTSDSCVLDQNHDALSFSGSGDYVGMGPAVETLGAAQFTVECWFKKLGNGATAGTGAFSGIPLVTKGRGVGDGSNVDMNYFLGIVSGKLAADFESFESTGVGGNNNPVYGATPLVDGVWYHAAATYNGSVWNLYLDGNLESSAAGAATPRFDSILHFGIGTTLSQTGVAAGFFDGEIDEVRVWDHALDQTEIQANMHWQVLDHPDLLGRWSMNSTDVDCQPGNDLCDTTGNGSHGDFFGTPAYVSAGIPELALCAYSDEPAATPCDDGASCSSRDECDGLGQCLGTLDHLGCADVNDCTIDACAPGDPLAAPLTGCLNAPDVGGVCTDGLACTDDVCVGASTGAVTLVHIEGNDETIGCDPFTALTYDPTYTFDGFTSSAISWTHVYTPPTLEIASATLTMDAGDLDGGVIQLRTADGTILGTIAGADNGGPGPFVCPAQWDGGIGNDNVLAIPSSQFADLADGSFFVEVVSAPGGAWASNRAKLTLTLNDSATCASAPVDCDDSNPCTNDSCDSGIGCIHDPIPGCCVSDGDCGDGDLCTTDTCVPSNVAALSFDGAGDYVDLGDPGGANTCADDPVTPNYLTTFGDSSFTIEGWVYKRDASPSDYSSIIRQGRAGAFPQVVVQLRSTGNLSLSVEPCGTGQTNVNTPLALNEWHHFAMVVDRGTLSSSAGDQWLRLYIDGVEEASADASANWAAKKIHNAANDSAILGANYSGTGVPAPVFDGMLDEIRIWDHVRTSTEILNNYDSQILSGVGLVHRWALNEGLGTTTVDSAGTADGTLINATWETANPPDFGVGTCSNPGTDCSHMVDACNTAACNPTNGLCEQTAVNDGGVCDDGDPCTESETCSSGLCTGTGIPNCCVTAADCDDADACTVDECITVTDNSVSLELDGANQYVDMDNDIALRGGTTGITIEAWIHPRPGSLGAGQRGTIVEKRTPTEEKGDYGLYLEDNSVTWRLYSTANEAAGNYEGSLVVSADSWQHVAVTYDDGTGERKIYVDGVLDTLADPTPRSGITSTSVSTHNLWLGRSDQGDFTDFDGLIDEVRVWDHPRTQQEIQDSMGLAVLAGTGLISRWSMDDNDAGTTVFDSVGVSNGTLTNGASLNTTNVALLDPRDECASSPLVCDDGNVCTTDSCDTVAGCEYDPLPNLNDPCDDGNQCTASDQCDGAGACAGSPDIGAVCTDGIGCTENDVCDAAGLCVPGSPNDELCDDGELCTADSCDPLNGCVIAFAPGPCDDNNACTDNDQCNDPNLRNVVGTETCDPLTSLTYDASSPYTGYTTAMISWTHVYSAFSGTIVSATLTMDIGDADTGSLELRAADGTVIGILDGGDNGSPGPFVCPDQWDAFGGDPDGNDITLTIPPSLYPDLADGDFFVETVAIAGVSSWASNRAVLEVELADYCGGAPVVCDDGDNCNGVESCDPALGCQSGPARGCDDGNDCTVDTCIPAQNDDALSLDGSSAHVTMGVAPGLGASEFTLEAWINWDGGGDTASSGSGGVVGVPIIAKGLGEADGNNKDCNYFFGVMPGTGYLAGDFEDLATGGNHPVIGTAGAVSTGVWHHVAATYDGNTWRLYLDGQETGSQGTGGAVPRFDSIQHFAIGAAIKSTGARDGAFNGRIDEVRVWNRALDPIEIQANMLWVVLDDPDQLGRWSLDSTDVACAPGNDVCDTSGNGNHGDLGGSPVYSSAGLVDLLDCSYSNEPATTFCDDDFGCTINGECDGLGLCIETADHAACGDGNQCTLDSCDPDDPAAGGITGCVNAPDVGAACDDGDACTVDVCVGESLSTTIVDLVGTDSCDEASSLSGGWITGDISWTHIYPPITTGIVSATITMDTGDADAGSLILTGDGVEIPGLIVGGDNGGPGDWHCPDQWVNGADNTLVLPPSFYPLLEDGSFTIETSENAAVSTWGSNRAILTIEVIDSATCDSSTPTVCDDGDACTANLCDSGTGCYFDSIPGCCLNDGDCDDGEGCTIDSCWPTNPAALSLDGSNDIVDLGNPGGANTCTDDPGTPNYLTSFGDSSFTIEGWVFSRDATPTEYAGIFRQGWQGPQPQVAVQMRATGKIALSVEPCGTGQRDVSAPLPPNEWHHFAMVVDRGTLSSTAGSQFLRLYLDGVEVDSIDASTQWAAKKINDSAAQSAILGAAYSTSGAIFARFDGMIDEFRIWDYARTPAEIMLNHNVQVDAAPGLVHRWDMDEGTGPTAADSIGSADGTLVNGPVWETTLANLNDFNANTCLNAPDVGAACDDGDACTDDACGGVSLGTTVVDIVGNDVAVTCDAATSLTGGFISTGLNWTHSYAPLPYGARSATVTIDGGDLDALVIELRGADGTSIGTFSGGDNGGPGPFVCPDQWDLGIGNDTTLPIPASLLPDLADGNFYIEAVILSGGGAWGGNRAILTIDAVDFSTCESTPTICDDGNVCTTDACDPVTGCYADIIPGCCLTDGDCDDGQACTSDSCAPPNPAALGLDGSNDYVDLGDPGGGNTCVDDPVTPNYVTSFSDSSFTIEGWVYSRGPVNYACIFRQGRQSGNPQVVVQVLADGSIQPSIETCDGGRKSLTATLPLNEWHHFAMVVDRGNLSASAGSQWLRFYLDGAETGFTDTSSAWAAKKINNFAAESALMGVARNGTGAFSSYFNGLIDELRIWDHARTPAEILADHNAQIASAPGLVHRWAMDEGSGLTAADSVGAANGTLTNGPVWETDPANLNDFNANACSNDPVVCVDDGVACTVETCDPGTGDCVSTPTDALCDDGNACTTDSCDSITGCLNTPVDIDDGVACTDDACDPGTGDITHTPNNGLCGDGDLCTDDVCNAASGCENPAIPIDDSIACTDDACDPGTGDITHTPNNGLCGDGDLCTDDVCNAATGCENPAIPIDDSIACTDDACDPGTGDITHTPNNGLCGDGDLCTDDVCDSGLGCQNPAVDVDDGIACTDDSCDPGTGDIVNAPNNGLCGDGDLCTDDVCNAASGCENPAIPIDDSIACTDDACDPGTGDITHAPNNGLCGDGDLCTDDVCNAASGCENPAIPIDDSIACTDDACDPGTGDITHTPNNGLCGDGDLCTDDVCNAASGCENPAIPIDDSIACTDDACDPGTGDITHTPNNGLCGDGDLCTDDVCDAASGCENPAIPIDDSIACTDDACDPGTGDITHTPNNGLCGDGDLCTDDVCNAATGCENPAVDVDDSVACTDDACDPGTGDITHTPNNGLCGDGDLCTDDVCDSGLGCQNPAVDVDDGIACTDDSCDPGTGDIVNAPNNGLCGDSSLCTDDVCNAASGCENPAIPIDDSIACTDDACDPGTGDITHTPNNGLCGDGDLCTDDVCNAAAGCENPAIPFDDSIACTDDACDPGTGDITHTPNNGLCDDGDACSADVCSIGAGGCDHTGICGISGTVYYYRDDGTASEPSTKTVPNVEIDSTDDGVAEEVTDGNGLYAIPDLYGSYVVTTLDKYGDPRISDPYLGISSLDASLIAQSVVNQITLSTHQQVAADVTGNGQITSFDAANIAQYAVEQIDHFEVGTAAGSDWLFYRCDRYDGESDHDCVAPVYTHSPLTESATDDFYAILYGDVTGNWVVTGRSAVAGAEAEAHERDAQQAAALRANPVTTVKRSAELGPARIWVSGPAGVVPAGKQWTATVNLGDADGITAIDLGLDYDASHVSILAVDRAGLADGLFLTGNDLGDRYLVSLFGVLPMEGSGAILTVRLVALKEIKAADALSITAEANEGRIKLETTFDLEIARPDLQAGEVRASR